MKIEKNGIYKYIDDDGDIEIFRVNENSRYCTTIVTWSKNFHRLGIYDNLISDVIEETTDEEKIWFEFCEKHNKFFNKDYVLKQFI